MTFFIWPRPSNSTLRFRSIWWWTLHWCLFSLAAPPALLFLVPCCPTATTAADADLTPSPPELHRCVASTLLMWSLTHPQVTQTITLETLRERGGRSMAAATEVRGKESGGSAGGLVVLWWWRKVVRGLMMVMEEAGGRYDDGWWWCHDGGGRIEMVGEWLLKITTHKKKKDVGENRNRK